MISRLAIIGEAISLISFSITPKVSKIADTTRDDNAKNMIRSLGRILKTDELIAEVFVSPVQRYLCQPSPRVNPCGSSSKEAAKFQSFSYFYPPLISCLMV